VLGGPSVAAERTGLNDTVSRDLRVFDFLRVRSLSVGFVIRV